MNHIFTYSWCQYKRAAYQCNQEQNKPSIIKRLFSPYEALILLCWFLHWGIEWYPSQRSHTEFLARHLDFFWSQIYLLFLCMDRNSCCCFPFSFRFIFLEKDADSIEKQQHDYQELSNISLLKDKVSHLHISSIHGKYSNMSTIEITQPTAAWLSNTGLFVLPIDVSRNGASPLATVGHTRRGVESTEGKKKEIKSLLVKFQVRQTSVLSCSISQV